MTEEKFLKIRELRAKIKDLERVLEEFDVDEKPSYVPPDIFEEYRSNVFGYLKNELYLLTSVYEQI